MANVYFHKPQGLYVAGEKANLTGDALASALNSGNAVLAKSLEKAEPRELSEEEQKLLEQEQELADKLAIEREALAKKHEADGEKPLEEKKEEPAKPVVEETIKVEIKKDKE